MDKPTNNDFPIHDLLRRRWSPWSFSPRPVEAEKVASLFEAARWSPSGGNTQPWRFLVVTKEQPQAFERLLGALTERNQRWAASVPMLILTLAYRLKADGEENHWAPYDLGQSVAHLSVQASSLGLVVHQMGGFDGDAAREAFGIPEEYRPLTVVAVGYPGDPEELPDDIRGKQYGSRTRKALADFVFEGEWERPYRVRDMAVAGSGGHAAT